MCGIVGVTIVSKLKDVVYDAVKGKVDDKIDDIKLKDKIEKSIYDIFSKYEYNPKITFDLNKINDYVQEHLYDTCTAYFKESDSKKRKAIKNNIFLDAYKKIGATSLDDKHIIHACLQCVLDVIEDGYLKEIPVSMRYLGNKIVDDINYKGSFEEAIDNISNPNYRVSEYHYLSDKIHFVGREKDIQYLDEFINNPQLDSEDYGSKVQYTVITGTGGMGKSKLLYHYMKIHEVEYDKKIVFLTSSKIKELSEKHSYHYPMDLVLIVDYAAESAETLGKLINDMINSNTVDHKIHFILLEREGYQTNEINELNELNKVLPNWFEKFTNTINHNLAIEYMYRKESYSLFPLSENGYREIIDNVDLNNGKSLSVNDKNVIYKKFLEISKDDKLKTPLILILLTDYFIDCKKNNINFEIDNADKLMKYIIEKDKKYWKQTICDNDEEYGCLESLLIYATATGGWNFSILDEPLKDESSYIINKYSSRKKRISHFKNLIKSENSIDIVMPIEPDIIGEYFVIDYLCDQSNSKEIIDLLWKEESFLFFLFRTIETYANNTNFLYLVNKQKLFEQTNINEITARLYVKEISHQNLKNAEDTIKLLENLKKQYSTNEDMAFIYAVGLSNLEVKQKLSEERKETVAKLEELSNEHRTNEAVVSLYAKGLTNLTAVQNILVEKRATVTKLEELFKQHGTNEEVVSAYAVGLFNLTVIQKSPEELKITITKLEELSNNHRMNECIVSSYAKGLANLIVAQNSLVEMIETITKLEELSNDFRTYEYVVSSYAKALVSLTAEQESIEEIIETITKLEELSNDFGTYEYVVSSYANGLFNLILSQQISRERKDTVIKLEELSKQHGTNEDVVSAYAKGLVSLIAVQESTEERKDIVIKLEELSKQHGTNEEVVSAYAKGLFNLMVMQKPSEEIKEIVTRLEELSYEYRTNEDVASVCAKGLVNSLVVQNSSVEIVVTITKLEKLSYEHRTNEDVVSAYANALSIIEFKEINAENKK